MRDNDDNAGIANFVGEMLSHGTKNKNVYQLAEGFDFLGAHLETDTDYLLTSLIVNGLKKDAGVLMQLLAEMLQNASFPQAEVEKVRTELLTGLREEMDDTALVVDQVLRERIYPQGHPFRRKVDGTVKSVEKLKQQDLLAFYRRYYQPDQIIVTVAGDTNPDEMFELAEKFFGSWTLRGPSEALAIPAVSPGLGVGEQVVRMKSKSQCDIGFGIPGISIRSPDYYPLLILNYILGQSGLGGRLGSKIRDEEGLAYEVSSSFDANLGEGPFVIRAGVSPEQVDRTLSLIKEEVQKMRTKGVTEQEVAVAKGYLINSLPIKLESNEGIARELMHIDLLQLGDDYLSRFPDQVEAVRLDQVMDCARTRLLFDQAAVVIAGPYESHNP
jgi:zinc protease